MNRSISSFIIAAAASCGILNAAAADGMDNFQNQPPVNTMLSGEGGGNQSGSSASATISNQGSPLSFEEQSKYMEACLQERHIIKEGTHISWYINDRNIHVKRDGVDSIVNDPEPRPCIEVVRALKQPNP